jgi:hypothetical protein
VIVHRGIYDQLDLLSRSGDEASRVIRLAVDLANGIASAVDPEHEGKFSRGICVRRTVDAESQAVLRYVGGVAEDI